MPDLNLDDYAGLATTFASYHYNRQDLATAFPVYVKLFEAKMNRELRCHQMETRAYTDVLEAPSEPAFISLPSDFQTMRRLRIMDQDGVTRGAPLKFRTNFQMDDVREQSTDSGDPLYFTVFNDEMELWPTPTYPLRLEMLYRRTIPPLNATDDTNWLLDLAPDAYLYGTLMESAPYVREDERVPLWAQGLSAAVQGLNALSNDVNFNSGPLTMSRRRRGY